MRSDRNGMATCRDAATTDCVASLKNTVVPHPCKTSSSRHASTTATKGAPAYHCVPTCTVMTTNTTTENPIEQPMPSISGLLGPRYVLHVPAPCSLSAFGSHRCSASFDIMLLRRRRDADDRRRSGVARPLSSRLLSLGSVTARFGGDGGITGSEVLDGTEFFSSPPAAAAAATPKAAARGTSNGLSVDMQGLVTSRSNFRLSGACRGATAEGGECANDSSGVTQPDQPLMDMWPCGLSMPGIGVSVFSTPRRACRAPGGSSGGGASSPAPSPSSGERVPGSTSDGGFEPPPDESLLSRESEPGGVLGRSALPADMAHAWASGHVPSPSPLSYPSFRADTR
eukprot:Rhum_TRINITY_DN7504_c0_g1::Rhum_TRINITY_DN7504_c0_g1_i1::g.23269::m.23269